MFPDSVTRWMTTALLVALPATGLALSTDREQPVHIRADHFEADRQKGIAVYRGNVVMTQGTIRIEADVVHIHQPDGQLEKVVGDGRPARFRQRPDDTEFDIKGRSRHFEYLIDRNLIHLEGEAHIEQDRDQFTGERIIYDTARGLVQSSGGEQGRVHAILQPRNNGNNGAGGQ